jgi:hypothetical protein
MKCPCCDIEQSGPEKPVLRIYVDRSSNSVWLESVQEVIDNNAGYEDSAWMYLGDALVHGIYDDGDRSSAITSYYVCVDPTELRTQMLAWREQVKDEDWFDSATYELPQESSAR